MKIELKDSYFIEETGESIAIYNTDLGTVIGKMKLHPEEKYPSKFFGQELAKRKGIINYCQRVLKKEKAYLKSIASFQQKVLSQSPKDILNSSAMEYLLETIEKEKDFYKENIKCYNKMKKDNYKKIEQMIDEREKLLDRVYSKEFIQKKKKEKEKANG